MTATPAESGIWLRLACWLSRLGERIAYLCAKYERPLLIGLPLAFAVLLGGISLLTPFWFDELFTVTLARGTIHDILHGSADDGQPPLQYLLTRYVMLLSGPSEFAVRLPELLTYLAAAVLVYRIVRRRSDATYAFLAMVMVLASGRNDAAYTARPYPLMLAFVTLAILSWQRATENRTSRLWPLIGITVGTAGAISSHYYGLFHVCLPLAFGETVRLVRRRRLDLPLYTALGLGLAAMIPYLPAATLARDFVAPALRQATAYAFYPNFSNLRNYATMLPTVLPLIVLIFALALFPTWRRRPSDSRGPLEDLRSIPLHELAAAIGMSLLLPFLLAFCAVAATGYMPRYAIGTAVGLAMLAGFTLPHLGTRKDFLKPLASLSLAALVVISLGLGTVRVVKGFTLHQPAVDPLLLRQTGDTPIVVASAMDYVPFYWYAPPALRRRLVYLEDIPYAIHQPDFIPELALAYGKGHLGMDTAPYRSFLASHPRFLLYYGGIPRLEWTRDRLQAEGWQLKLQDQLDERQLYQAEAPRLGH